MITVLIAVLIILASLGLNLAMVVGTIPPSLFLALASHGGIVAGMFLLLLPACRRVRLESGRPDRRPPAPGRTRPGTRPDAP